MHGKGWTYSSSIPGTGGFTPDVPRGISSLLSHVLPAPVISSFYVCVCFPHLSVTLALLLQRLAVQMQMGLHPGWISIVQKYGPIDGIQ